MKKLIDKAVFMFWNMLYEFAANVQWDKHRMYSMRFEKLCWPNGFPFVKSDMDGRVLDGWHVSEIEVHDTTKRATVLRKLVFKHECGALHTAASYIPTHPNCKCQILN